MRLGLLGGSFDPVHHGHLISAAALLEACALDRIRWIPSARPPHKTDRTQAPFADRWAMLQAAIEDDPRFEADDLESRREGLSYTLDTVREVRRELGDGDTIVLLVGADSLSHLADWREVQTLLTEVELAVASRPGAAPLPDRLRALLPVDRPPQMIETPRIEISSTRIRERVASGRSIRYLVPAAVRTYILSHGLYRSASRD